MLSTTFIYALFEGESVRYIGKSNNPKRRLISHLSEKGRYHKTAWIAKMVKNGRLPELVILDEVPMSNWPFWEQHYICLFKSWGFDLVNTDKGGLGPSGLDLEARKKMSELRIGRKHSEETKAKIGASRVGKKRPPEVVAKMRERKCSDETRKKIGASSTGRFFSQEVRKKMSGSHIGTVRSDETKAKIGNVHRGKVLSEETKAKIKAKLIGGKLSEETKEKIRIAGTGRNHTEETKAKMRGKIPTNEQRLKMSEARRIWHQNNKAKQLNGLP